MGKNQPLNLVNLELASPETPYVIQEAGNDPGVGGLHVVPNVRDEMRVRAMTLAERPFRPRG
jgi:hypothetical protein